MRKPVHGIRQARRVRWIDTLILSDCGAHEALERKYGAVQDNESTLWRSYDQKRVTMGILQPRAGGPRHRQAQLLQPSVASIFCSLHKTLRDPEKRNHQICALFRQCLFPFAPSKPNRRVKGPKNPSHAPTDSRPSPCLVERTLLHDLTHTIRRP